jgi:hypothetical protein
MGKYPLKKIINTKIISILYIIMEKVSIVLYDTENAVIMRQSLEFRETESPSQKRKVIQDYLLYLIRAYSQDIEIAKIEILRELN